MAISWSDTRLLSAWKEYQAWPVALVLLDMPDTVENVITSDRQSPMPRRPYETTCHLHAFKGQFVIDYRLTVAIIYHWLVACWLLDRQDGVLHTWHADIVFSLPTKVSLGRGTLPRAPFCHPEAALSTASFSERLGCEFVLCFLP
jgi:hypothetical protein